MGDYHWLIEKQSKAIGWWRKAMREGARLGARPDLSRTYLEVGKRLQEPKSKYKKLDHIGAKSYLEKARNMFEELGLQKDKDSLDEQESQYTVC
jgi:hypothetical protein